MNKAGMSDPLTQKGSHDESDFDVSFIESIMQGNIDPNLVHFHTWCDVFDDYSDHEGPPSDFKIRVEQESILHRAIKCSALGVDTILLEKGADLNKTQCLYVSGKGKKADAIQISSLDLARTVSKNEAIICEIIKKMQVFSVGANGCEFSEGEDEEPTAVD